MSNGRRYDKIVSFIEKLSVHFYTFIQKHRFYSWGPGSRIRTGAKLVSPYLMEISSGVEIGEHAWLNAKDSRGDCKPTLRIGNGTSVGRFVHINAWKDVIIEDDVLIADRVFISDADHKFDQLDIPIMSQGDYFRGSVKLCTGCWIGIGSVILPGVTVGRNAIVAANSVVRKNVPDFAIVSGNPAIVIKVLINPKSPGETPG